MGVIQQSIVSRLLVDAVSEIGFRESFRINVEERFQSCEVPQ